MLEFKTKVFFMDKLLMSRPKIVIKTTFPIFEIDDFLLSQKMQDLGNFDFKFIKFCQISIFNQAIFWKICEYLVFLSNIRSFSHVK